MSSLTNSIDEAPKIRRYRRWRLAFLLGLLAIEVVLIVSLRQRGWIATTDSTRWILTAIAAFLPLGVAAVMFATSWRRLRLRTLFFCIAAICIFLSVFLSPLVSIRNSRRGAIALLDASVELLPQSQADYWDNLADYDPRKKFPLANDIPRWLLPLVKNLETIPHDQEVVGVTLGDDDEVAAFVEQLPRLPNIRHINLYSQVTDDGIRKLVEQSSHLTKINGLGVAATNTTRDGVRGLTKLTGVRWLFISVVKIPEDGWFDEFSQLRTLHVWDEPQYADPLAITVRWSQKNMDAVAQQKQLRHLQLTGLELKGIDISGLAQLPELEALGAMCHNVDAAQLQSISDQIAVRSEPKPVVIPLPWQ